jgi:hypothetical protein
MKTFKIGLLPKIIIAIVCGVVFGMFLPGEVVRVFLTFNGIFSQFLGFLIPLLILGLVAPAISDIGQGAGKMLIATTALAYFATVTSGLLSYAVSELTFPSLIDTQTTAASLATTEAMAPFFTVEIPAPMNVMTALVLAFTLGLTTATMQSVALKNVMKDFMQVIIKTINVAIIPLLPIYIFGIFLNMAYTGDAARVLTVFVKIIGVIFVMHIFLLIFQYCVAGAFVGKNPFRLLGRMLPAYFTALGTQSSAATIPVTLLLCHLVVSATKELLDLNLSLELHHTIEDCLRTWRTAWDIHINRHEFIDTTHYIIALLERSATDGASSDGNDILWLSHLIIKTLEYRCHLVGDSTGTHDKVCLTWRVTCHLKSETREVIACTTHRHEFDTTATGTESERPQRVASSPVDHLIKGTEHHIATAFMKLVYYLLKSVIVLKLVVRNAFDNGFSYFHSNAPFRQA